MDTNPISSLLENLKQKFTNPFLGTFILVWIVHNWRLVFSFFNFDERTTLERKMKVISPYYDLAFSIENLAVSAVITLGVLIASFIGINIARIIVETSERIIKPTIMKIAGSAKVVERKDLEDVEDALEVWVKKHADELSAKNAIQKQYDEMVEKNNEMEEVADVSQDKERIGILLKEEVQQIYDKLKDEGLIEPILEVFPKVIRHEYIPNSSETDALLLHELVEIMGEGDAGIRYKLTPKGSSFKNILLLRPKNNDPLNLNVKNTNENFQLGDELLEVFYQIKERFSLQDFEKIHWNIKKIKPEKESEFTDFLLNNDLIAIKKATPGISDDRRDLQLSLTESGKKMARHIKTFIYGHED